MIKLLEVIGRRADWTHEDFVKHQIVDHLEVVSQVPDFVRPVRRYLQNHFFIDPKELAPIKGLPISSNTDSVIEVWYDKFADIMQAFGNPKYMEIIRPDELSFGDVAGAWGVLTRDTVVMERPGFSGRIKLFAFLKRDGRSNHAQFAQRWQESGQRKLEGSKAFKRLVGRWTENWVTQDPAEAAPGMRDYDLVVELGFDSLQEVAQFTTDPDVIAAFTGTAASFIDQSQTLFYVGAEHPASAEWHRRMQARV